MPGSQTTRVIPSTNTYDLELAEQDIADLRSHVTTTQEASTQTDVTDQPITPTGGNTQFSSSGQQKYVGSDANAYNTGRLSLRTQADQTISSTTATPITVLSGIAVAAIAYRLHAMVRWTQGSAAVTQRLGWTGTMQAGTRIEVLSVPGTGGSATQVYPDEVVSNTAVTLPGFAASQVAATYLDGVIVFTSPDTFGLTAWEGTNGDTWTVKAGSFLDLMPIS